MVSELTATCMRHVFSVLRDTIPSSSSASPSYRLSQRCVQVLATPRVQQIFSHLQHSATSPVSLCTMTVPQETHPVGLVVCTESCRSCQSGLVVSVAFACVGRVGPVSRFFFFFFCVGWVVLVLLSKEDKPLGCAGLLAHAQKPPKLERWQGSVSLQGYWGTWAAPCHSQEEWRVSTATQPVVAFRLRGLRESRPVFGRFCFSRSQAVALLPKPARADCGRNS